MHSKGRALTLFDREHPGPARELALEGILADSITAEQAPAAREAAVARFRAGRTHVLVATDLLARGMDFLNVATVVNYDFPLSAVDYVHRCLPATLHAPACKRLPVPGASVSVGHQPQHATA
jgi:hypothetical protein